MKTYSGQTIKNYLIGALLAQGATGDVYQARSVTGQQVAIKILNDKLAEDGEFQQRFIREIRLTIALAHDHIVPILDFGYENDALFMVSKLIHGPSLAERVKKHPPTLAEVGIIIQHIAPAVHAGHQQGIIHRDLKPGNILYDEIEKKYYLSDFGFSKRPGIDSNLTDVGIAVGTPNYISPEAIVGENLGAHSDVYSFAVMVYELLVGVLPFQQKQIYDLSMAHMQVPPPRMIIHAPDFPLELETVVLKGLAKKPEERHPSMLAFASDYADALAEFPTDIQQKSFWKTS